MQREPSLCASVLDVSYLLVVTYLMMYDAACSALWVLAMET